MPRNYHFWLGAEGEGRDEKGLELDEPGWGAWGYWGSLCGGPFPRRNEVRCTNYEWVVPFRSVNVERG